ncbi:Lar family restriction alleviation protein [Kaistia sp. MMO-174]|uniref:Lar family restriction alleviation protein n=1 Tax=Kaistia sp. MMO-174 TaxID=3081256 RepID=UPI003018E687
MTKPKPCPFCGGENIELCDTSVFWYRCDDCLGETDSGATADEAVAKWNRRASPPAPAVAVKPWRAAHAASWPECFGLEHDGEFVVHPLAGLSGPTARRIAECLNDYDRQRIRSALVDPAPQPSGNPGEMPAPAAPAWREFNINRSVRVKLTDAGAVELKRQHDELRERFPTLPEWQDPRDADGWYKEQLWLLMRRLGHMHRAGVAPDQMPFAIEIEIPAQGDPA